MKTPPQESSPTDEADPTSSRERAQQTRLDALATSQHRRCLLCGADNQLGLKLRFRAQPDGAVLAVFPCAQPYQSYDHTLHGGVIAALLDSAMTNALFAAGVVGVTGELNIRFCAPVELARGAVVRGWLEHSTPPLYYLRAELSQGGDTCARASAKFMERR